MTLQRYNKILELNMDEKNIFVCVNFEIFM